MVDVVFDFSPRGSVRGNGTQEPLRHGLSIYDFINIRKGASREVRPCGDDARRTWDTLISRNKIFDEHRNFIGWFDYSAEVKELTWDGEIHTSEEKDMRFLTPMGLLLACGESCRSTRNTSRR